MAVQTLHLINNDAGPQTLRTRAGDAFVMGAYIYPKTGNTGGGTVKLNLHCSSSTGSPAATDVTAYTGAVPATGAWAYVSGSAIVPAGYDTVDPELTLTSVPVGDTIYVDDVLVREQTSTQNLADSIYQALTGTATTNNPWSAVATQFSTWISNLFGGTSIQTTIQQAAVPGLNASKITSGTFAQSMVTGLSAFYNALTGAGTAGSAMPDFQTIIDNLNKVITGSATTGQAIGTWLTNLQSWATNLWGGTTLQSTLTQGVIPGLQASKITSGNLLASVLPLVIPSANVPALQGLFGSNNEVLNPDFENSTLWTGAVGSQSTAQSHSTSHSWAVNGAG